MADLKELIVRGVLHCSWRLTRGLTLGAQGVIEDGRGGVLLVRHTYRPGWHFPGGGVSRGETVEAALAREIMEETGTELTGPPALFGIYSNNAYFRGDHIVLFRVTGWRPIAGKPPDASAEIAEARFFQRANLPPGLNPPTARRIAEIFNGAVRSATW